MLVAGESGAQILGAMLLLVIGASVQTGLLEGRVLAPVAPQEMPGAAALGVASGAEWS